MTIKRMDHVGVVVEDLGAAEAFFAALGLKRQGGGSVEGEWVDRIVGLEGVRSEIVFLQTPDGHSRLELTKFLSPSAENGANPPANAPFLVTDVDAVLAGLRAHGGELVGEVERCKDVYRLCYVRGPEEIIVELAEELS
jgi:catechol 2,3-dioxygenase-like lactoylglutathione lyase family enzyme